MAEFRIREANTDRIRASFPAPISPDDTTSCIFLLRDEIRRRQLRHQYGFILLALDRRRGWVEVTPCVD